MNIQYFDTLNDANNFVIADIPFVAYCAENLLTLYCKEDLKKIVVNNSNMEIDTYTPPPEVVDLGLSVKWAKWNLGASNETDYGDYYAWGEVETKNDYSWDTYTRHTNDTYSSSNKKVFIKYVPTNQESTYWAGTGSADNKLVLEPVDDIVNVQLGGNYRMPTEAEFRELLDVTKVTNTWKTKNDVYGIEFTSLINGNTLFIPAAGFYKGSSLQNVGYNGNYWSSNRYWIGVGSIYIELGRGGIYSQVFDFRYGLSIRPVLAN